MKDLRKLLLALAAIGCGILGLLSGRPIPRKPGVLAAEQPLQTPAPQRSWRYRTFTLTTRASYDITARVLSVERYHVDAGSSLAPMDFAVGWGPMSDTATLQHFRVTQGSRFFTLYPDDRALDIHEALLSSANMHVIPANERVAGILGRARSGNVAHLNGYLIDARRDDGFTWNSSLTREDTGEGACELMWVENAELH